MKIARLFLMSVMSTFNSISYPDSARILCDNADCNTYIIPNGLKLNFTGCSYMHFHRKRTIGIYCTIENKESDTLLFVRSNYAVISKKEKFFSESFGFVKNYKYFKVPDSFKIGPGDMIDYVFEYRSEDKLTHKEYKELILTDTLDFIYKQGQGNEKILSVIGIPK